MAKEYFIYKNKNGKDEIINFSADFVEINDAEGGSIVIYTCDIPKLIQCLEEIRSCTGNLIQGPAFRAKQKTAPQGTL